MPNKKRPISMIVKFSVAVRIVPKVNAAVKRMADFLTPNLSASMPPKTTNKITGIEYQSKLTSELKEFDIKSFKILNVNIGILPKCLRKATFNFSIVKESIKLVYSVGKVEFPDKIVTYDSDLNTNLGEVLKVSATNVEKILITLYNVVLSEGGKEARLCDQ